MSACVARVVLLRKLIIATCSFFSPQSDHTATDPRKVQCKSMAAHTCSHPSSVQTACQHVLPSCRPGLRYTFGSRVPCHSKYRAVLATSVPLAHHAVQAKVRCQGHSSKQGRCHRLSTAELQQQTGSSWSMVPLHVIAFIAAVVGFSAPALAELQVRGLLAIPLVYNEVPQQVLYRCRLSHLVKLHSMQSLCRNKRLTRDLLPCCLLGVQLHCLAQQYCWKRIHNSFLLFIKQIKSCVKLRSGIRYARITQVVFDPAWLLPMLNNHIVTRCHT